jgi:hypothetical protein
MANPLSSLDVSHGVGTGVITLALAKGWTMYSGANVDFMVQVEGAAVAGMSAVASDTILKSQSTLVRAGATGVLLSGAMWAWKGDSNWTVWIPVGVAAYYADDYLMKMWAAQSAKKGKGGANASAGGLPEVSGM